MMIINYGITPEGDGGRANLPLEVDTWLVPVELCLSKIRSEGGPG
jgi:hypothetical protein